jgi:hypothetical protein
MASSTVGQGQLDQDAMHRRIVVELANQVQQLVLAGVHGQLVLEGSHARLAGLLRLVANIDLARRVLAHQHHGKAWNEAVLGLELLSRLADARAQARGEGLAVDDFRDFRDSRLTHTFRLPNESLNSGQSLPWSPAGRSSPPRCYTRREQDSKGFVGACQ